MGKKEREAAVMAPKDESYMYIGQSLLSAGLLKNQVFRGGKPAMLDSLKEKYPLIEQLFVPIARIDNAMAEVKTKGTVLYLANQQLLGGEK